MSATEINTVVVVLLLFCDAAGSCSRFSGYHSATRPGIGLLRDTTIIISGLLKPVSSVRD